MKNVLIINGPNLNMLGSREPGVYGSETLESLNGRLRDFAREIGVKTSFFQSNHEGQIIDTIHGTVSNKIELIVINPGAFTHTSVAIRDALLSVSLPVIEVHLSNIFKRETFRHKSFISDVAVGVITGFGTESYFMGLRCAINILEAPLTT